MAASDASPFLIRPDATQPLSGDLLPPHPYTFPLDPFQQHAFAAIAKEHHVLVCAKTGSGKTLVGEYQIVHSLAKGKRVFYTTPIKSLSNQKFHDLKTLFPEARVGIMTGDIKFCPDAQIVIMTTEILRNLLYKRGTATESIGLTASLSMDDVDAVIFDECHYINDRDRGAVWEETIILLPSSIRMILLSATLDHPEFLAEWIGELKQTPIHLLETQHRVVPLTHYVFQTKEDDPTAGSLKMIMDAKETYFDPVYKKWLQVRDQRADAEWDHQRAAQQKRREGTKGGLDGKTRVASFVHQLNTAIAYLQKQELLPALCFVLSRKQCETYAHAVERSLLDVADASAVQHIIGFHLHRFRAQLDTNPQYHRLCDLLSRGIAFHHSGLPPLLKEIVEILFSKGYVKMLFCTETFAVGLNMPTKTVLFAGLKKYDDETGGMRLLRNDEYFQMAGRAGRRGKDDKGVVIYLPDHEPIQVHEMFQILKGARPPVTSRMNFHYDFLLKSLQWSSTLKDTAVGGSNWLHIMDKSYWIRQQDADRRAQQAIVHALEQKKEHLEIHDPDLKRGCELRAMYEHLVRTTVNAARKDAQRQLDTLKNRQLGPKWAAAWAAYQESKTVQVQWLEATKHLEALSAPQRCVEPALRILQQWGYLSEDANCEEVTSLTHTMLTRKGILATEVNEAHAILLTELYTEGHLANLSGTEVVCLLSTFLEHKEDEESDVDAQEMTPALRTAWNAMQQICRDFMADEIREQYGRDEDWAVTAKWMAPVLQWMEGTATVSEIAAVCGLFEGNLIRSILKLANMVEEVIAMATYCQHVEMVQRLMDVRPCLLREGVTSDSLYLHL